MAAPAPSDLGASFPSPAEKASVSAPSRDNKFLYDEGGVVRGDASK